MRTEGGMQITLSLFSEYLPRDFAGT